MVKIGQRGQVIIPKRLREEYGLEKDTEVEFVRRKEGVCIRKRRRRAHPVDSVYGIVKLQGANSVDEYIEAARGR